MNLQDVDVAVIGSGPAGMAAAIRAKETGAKNVVILERAEELGGLLHQCVHNGFGMFYFQQDLTGPEYAHRFIEKTMDVGVQPLLETMALGISLDREITAVNTGQKLLKFTPKSIVLAMGCREKSRGALGIPGTRPAGIFTAGTAQRFINVEGFLPGRRIVILGSGDIGMIIARRLTLEGARVEAVAEVLPYVGGLIRNEVQCLHDFDIPLFLKHTVSHIYGEKRVEAVTVAEVDENMRPIDGTQRDIACDTLLLSVGLIPENELSLTAGVALDPVTGGPVVDAARQTSVSGIFAGGNVVHVHDLVDNVTWESEIAGESAAKFAAGKKLKVSGGIKLKAGKNIRYIVPQTISGTEDVTLYMRVLEPQQNVRINVGKIVSKAELIVKPSSMLKIEISAGQLKGLGKKATELVVDCEQRGGR
jgi:NADPH-dependent 2,4-dienoyl-CoA reductase/sulfur reductase-like enzyme